MKQGSTAELRRWAHEEAFVRGDECPHITCDEILETLDRLCDEIDGTTEQKRTIDTILQELMAVSKKYPEGRRESRIRAEEGCIQERRRRARERLITRMRTYLYAAWQLSQESTKYDFHRALDETYAATCEVWELHASDTFDTRVRRVLAHVTSTDICDQYHHPIDMKTKKGLVCWIIATSRLSMEC